MPMGVALAVCSFVVSSVLLTGVLSGLSFCDVAMVSWLSVVRWFLCLFVAAWLRSYRVSVVGSAWLLLLVVMVVVWLHFNAWVLLRLAWVLLLVRWGCFGCDGSRGCGLLMVRGC